MGNRIVNCMYFPGSRRFMKIEKSQKKSSKNLKSRITIFLYHLKPLKNVHSFIQLEVLEIKISHRFQKTPPLHALSCRFCISLPVTAAVQLMSNLAQKTHAIFRPPCCYGSVSRKSCN